MNVSFEMIDRNQRLVERKCQSLGETDADQQRARQAWPLRNRKSIKGLVGLARIGQRLADDRHNGPQMLARSQFRHYSAIGRVGNDLREHDVRDNLLARSHDCGCGFVAGTLDAEDVDIGHRNYIIG